MTTSSWADAIHAAFGVAPSRALHFLRAYDGDPFGTTTIRVGAPGPSDGGNLFERLVRGDRAGSDLLWLGAVPIAAGRLDSYLGYCLYDSPFARAGDVVGADPWSDPWPVVVRAGLAPVEVGELLEDLVNDPLAEILDRARLLAPDAPRWADRSGGHPWLETARAWLRADGPPALPLGVADAFPVSGEAPWDAWLAELPHDLPRALHLLMRCTLLDEAEPLERALAAASAHPSRLLRDAAAWFAALRDGRDASGAAGRTTWLAGAIRREQHEIRLQTSPVEEPQPDEHAGWPLRAEETLRQLAFVSDRSRGELVALACEALRTVALDQWPGAADARARLEGDAFVVERAKHAAANVGGDRSRVCLHDARLLRTAAEPGDLVWLAVDASRIGTCAWPLLYGSLQAGRVRCDDPAERDTVPFASGVGDDWAEIETLTGVDLEEAELDDDVTVPAIEVLDDGPPTSVTPLGEPVPADDDPDTAAVFLEEEVGAVLAEEAVVAAVPRDPMLDLADAALALDDAFQRGSWRREAEADDGEVWALPEDGDDFEWDAPDETLAPARARTSRPVERACPAPAPPRPVGPGTPPRTER